MIKILKYVKPQLPFIALAVSILFIQALCDLSLPNIMAQLVNGILRNAGEGSDNDILSIGLTMFGITLLGGCAAVGVSFLFNRIAAGIARDLRHAVFEKVESFSSQEFDEFSTASLITRCTNDVSNIQGIFSVGVRMIFYAPIMGIGGVFMAMQKAPGMSWIIVVSVIVLIGIVSIIISIVLPRFKIIQGLLDKMNRIARETLNGLMVIRAFSAQEHDKKRFNEVNRDFAKNSLFVNRVMNIQMPAMQLIQNIAILIIIWNGAHNIAMHTMEVGDMMAFIQYTIQIIFAFQFISMIFIMLPRAAVSGERVAQVLEKDISIKDPKDPQDPKDPMPVSNNSTSIMQGARIEFEKLSFRYNGAEKDALTDISFTAERGETTAIIGATGSGKSTIINLILRFYDVTDGRILLDGMDIRNTSQKELRSNIGYVPQKSILLSGPVLYNLNYGKNDSTLDEVKEGAEIAQALDFIDNFPDGMEHHLAQGAANISGGQKQRLSIARALIKNPRLLLFDDSFSALDFATDARLRKTLEERRKDTTRIIVAQRVGTIMNADKIIVMAQGKIVGMGKHEDLIQSCLEYREIAESQINSESQIAEEGESHV